MAKIRVVQIDGNKILDDKGRVWLLKASANGEWFTWHPMDIPEEPTEEEEV